MKNEYSLKTNNPSIQLTISKLKHFSGDTENDNPYNTSAIISVISGDFCGKTCFEFDIKSFEKFIKDINDAYDNLKGIVVLEDLNCTPMSGQILIVSLYLHCYFDLRFI